MSHSHDWEAFFDGHAPEYMFNAFTANTLSEVDFIIDVLGLEAGQRVLDVGCGTGRHSVELARRGCLVTGIDLSAGMLEQACAAARRAGVEVEWIKADATQYQPPGGTFDAAVCLCEGAFSLLTLDDDPIEHDLAILRNIHRALVPGGGFLLTAINGLWHIRCATLDDVDQGRFDPQTMTETIELAWEAEGGLRSVTVRERGYTPTELQILCRMAGFEVRHVWGGSAGAWRREPVQMDEMEIMVVAEKPEC
jgi:cyclopropane fatty-acyl-phospholipid synthase-like methyltransferase